MRVPFDTSLCRPRPGRLMRGGSLAGVLAARGGTLSAAEAKVVGRCTLSALQDMHAGGYCHLDVKPDNVGVEEEGDLGTVALMDFGSAEPSGATDSLTLNVRMLM